MTELDEILRFFADYVGLAGVHPDSELFVDHGLDSIQVNDLLAFVEERWGVMVPGEAVTVEGLATPRTIAALVASLR